MNIAAGTVLKTSGNDFTATGENVNVAGSVQTGNPQNGGDITITSGNMITVTGTGSLLTALGAGGIVTIGSGVDLQAGSSVVAGAGNITLNSVGPVLDVIINTNIISGTSIFISALRDIIVQALVQTTNAADGNITLRADSDDDGVGGVWVQASGKVDAAQNVNLIGSDLFAIAGTQESVQIDVDGANDQVVALGDVTLQTAGFAPAGSDMNINGIVKTNGAGKTVTINSVGNINSSNNGVAEIVGDNASLNSVEGIDVETAVDNLSINNTTSGNISVENTGALTLTSFTNGSSGSTTIATLSPLTIAASIVQNGAIILQAGESGAAGDDLTVNSGVTVNSVNDNVILRAGDNVVLNAGSTVKSDSASVSVTAGFNDMDGNGDISLAGAINAFSNAVLTAAQGSITQTTGSITADSLSFVGEGTVTLANSNNNFANVSGSSTAGNINLANSAAATDIGNLQTFGGDITYNHSGAGSVEITGTVDSGNAGSVNGGNITVNNLGGSLTVRNSAVLTSAAGAGGILSVSNATIEGGATITLGQGNITLNGGGLDLIINVPIISATSIFLTALRDIIVQALVQTTNAADGNITLRADSDNDGEGGVWVQTNGEVDAAQNIDIMGSNLFAIPVTLESIQIDADGANPQVHTQNGGTIDLHTTGFAPAGSDMNLNGIVSTGGLLRVDSVGNINTSNDATAELVADQLKLTAVEGIDAEINANTAAVLNTTSGNVSLEDMAGGLTIGTVDGLVGGANNGGNTTVLTHSPLNVNANVSSLGNVTLAATGNAAADDLTLASGVLVSSTNNGDIVLAAGSDVNANANSLVTTGTGSITVASGEDFADFTFDQDGHADGDVNMASTAAFRSQDGNVIVDAARNAVVSEVNSNSNADGTLGDVTLRSRSGFVADSNGATNNVTGNKLTIESATGVADSAQAGDDFLETEINRLNLTNAGGTGKVQVQETLAGLNLDIEKAAQAGSGDMTIRTTDGTLTVLDAGSSGLGVSATSGETTLLAQGTASSTDDLLINNTVTSTSGKINLDSADDVIFSVAGDVTSVSGEIEVDATSFLTMADNGLDSTILNAGSGRIDLDAGLDINLASVKTTSALDDAVVIVSRGGRIIDGGDTDGFNIRTGAFAENPAIFDGGLILSAFNGIGVDTDANGGLETKVGKLAAYTNTDDIQVFNTGALDITTLTDPDAFTSLGFSGVGTIAGATIAGGDPSAFIFITAASPMVVSANVTNFAGGNITLFALGNLDTDTMTLTNGADVLSLNGNGNILMTSGGTMTLNNGSIVQTTSNTVPAGFGNIIMAAGVDSTGAGPVPTGGFPAVDLSRDGNANADLIMASDSAVRTDGGNQSDTPGGGNITMNAERNLLIAEVNADADSTGGDNLRGDVVTNSFTGDTLDSNDVAPNAPGTMNIIADVWTAFSGGVIGQVANPIESTANVINAIAFGDIFIDNVGDVLINLFSQTGTIGFTTIGDIFLGFAHAPQGDVSLTATGSILAVDSGTHVQANNNIKLTAGNVIGLLQSGVNTQFNTENGQLVLNAGGVRDGVSINIGSNIPSSLVSILGAPGLVLFNGIAIGGDNISNLNQALSQMFVDILPFNQLSTGRLDGRYAADFPGNYNADTFATAPLVSIDTTRLDTLPVLEALPPTVVPIPGAAPTPTPAPTKAPEAPKAPAPAKQVTQGQTPPTIVPIPAEATPTLTPDVEKKS